MDISLLNFGFCACLLSCLLTSAYASPPNISFTPAEHSEIGNQIILRYNLKDKGEVGQPLKLMNGLSLTYGEIITSGDFYAAVNEPISQGNNAAERRKRFFAAFDTLALDQAAVDEMPRLMRLFKEERQLIDAAIKEGKPLDQLYKEIGSTFDIQFNCITGGGCTEATWLINQGRYLKVALDNYDHFGKDAVIAYETGHQLALEEAVAARQTNNISRLEVAYAINAYASHFLSDRFSVGHMRTPRYELAEHVTPRIVGSALASYMHSEENRYGLHVSNGRGDHWVAYGDKTYFMSKAETHKKIIKKTLQASADEVFQAYTLGYITPSNFVTSLIPHPDEVNNHSKLDISPMFYWDEKSSTLYRRNKLDQPEDREWISNWWGWSTFFELRKVHDIELFTQADLAHSAYKFQALKDGLITEPSLIAYIQRQIH